MAGIPHYVVDNSVAAKWGLRFRDEAFLDESLQLLADYQVAKVVLLAPQLLAYEHGSSLRGAARRRRITEGVAHRELSAFLHLHITLIYDAGFLHRALELSVQFGAAYSDSVYLALSEAAQVPFIHADDRLRRALAGRFPHELWVGDYRSPV